MKNLLSIFPRLFSLIRRGFTKLADLVKKVHEVGIMGILKELKEGFKKLLTQSMNTTAWVVLFFEAVQKLLGLIGIGTAVASGGIGAKQIFDFGKAILDPQSQMLNWLDEALSALPDINELFAGLDNMLISMTTGYFTPPLSFTYLLKVTAVGACFNQYLQALISTLIFVFSIFLVKWAFSNKFTFTKSLPN